MDASGKAGLAQHRFGTSKLRRQWRTAGVPHVARHGLRRDQVRSSIADPAPLLWTAKVWRIMPAAGTIQLGAAVEVIIIGGGIGGLTLALALHQAGVPSRVYEAAPEIEPIGVGINLLPHAMRELAQLGLETPLAARGVVTSEAVFFNRFGQLIYREALGRGAGYAWPQISMHRGDLQAVLVDAFRSRGGSGRLMLGWLCTGAVQDERAVIAHFEQTGTGQSLPPQRGDIVIGCDGIHSMIRKQLFPDEGEPIYSGVNMWRGVTSWPP